MAFIATQWTLFIATICHYFVVSNCLFVTKISQSNLLGSCEEKLTFNKLFISRAKGLTKIQALKGKSTVISSQQSREPKPFVCLHSALPVQTLIMQTHFKLQTSPVSYICWFRQRKIFANMLHRSFSMKLIFYTRKSLVSRITFLVTKIIWIHFFKVLLICYFSM